MWEDKGNRQGGRWLFTSQRNYRQQDLDRIWLETVRHYLLLLFSFNVFTIVTINYFGRARDLNGLIVNREKRTHYLLRKK